LIFPFIRRFVPRAIRTGLRLLALGLVVAGVLAIGACGSGSSSPNPLGSPPATPPPGGAATFNIVAGVVSPRQVEINVGQRVAFVNNDTSAHEIASDPHPVHTDCPPINDVGGLAPGTARLTGAFTIPRTCGFHDHGQPDNTSLQGTIIIH
jgi:plastocyanin